MEEKERPKLIPYVERLAAQREPMLVVRCRALVNSPWMLAALKTTRCGQLGEEAAVNFPPN
jgi:hypothetical protein